MDNETRYNIVAETNQYLANRLGEFNGKCRIVKAKNLTLKKAQKALLDLYNELYDGERHFARNWGLAVIQSRGKIFGAAQTKPDGTRSFGYDSVYYGIAEVEVEVEQ